MTSVIMGYRCSNKLQKKESKFHDVILKFLMAAAGRNISSGILNL